jgi:hypothetical protein
MAVESRPTVSADRLGLSEHPQLEQLLRGKAHVCGLALESVLLRSRHAVRVCCIAGFTYLVADLVHGLILPSVIKFSGTTRRMIVAIVKISSLLKF